MFRFAAKTQTGVVTATAACLAMCGAAAAFMSDDDAADTGRPRAGLTIVKSLASPPAQKLPAQGGAARAEAAETLTDAVLTRSGVNVSGGEFGKVPGRLGYDYDYPNPKEIDYYKAQGFKILRIPFRWERLQPELYGPLSATDRASLKRAVDYATDQNLVVVLDMHDYAARRPSATATSKFHVGSTEVPASALTDAWVKIMGDYKEDRRVWLGLMNEPSGLSGSTWWPSVQELVLDLRKQRIGNKLLVPGVSWTGAHSWLKSGNAAYAESFRDPRNNFAFEVHQYLDSDSSGTHATCSPGSSARVDAVLSWAQQRGVTLFFGEIAAGPDPSCRPEYTAMLAKLNTSPVVLGWTAWGGGKWWNPSYMFRLAPVTPNTPTAHMQMLLDNLPRRRKAAQN